MHTARLIVTIPRDKYARIEQEKKRRGLTRSAVVSMMVNRFFLKNDEAAKVRRYLAGYRKKPEKLKGLAALEKIQLQSLGEF